ncbi:MAG: Unknown protein [uncultured Sulfurovum sp.]|uniref:PIN domain-containing protein n=1 Tax=uncultured Sulfurovum sp. TaxID=269237 RepID=A0A6S6TZ25_9BACT|nr:MAG: Unknown protein [uncultured Sulfurovum sp.]
MTDKVLLDANIIIRFFEGSEAMHYGKSLSIMQDIQGGKIKVLLLDLIIAEIIYVSKHIYRREKSEISNILKEMIMMDNFYVENQPLTLEALSLYENKNIDFADAMLCAKKNLQGYEVMSFDKDLKKC